MRIFVAALGLASAYLGMVRPRIAVLVLMYLQIWLTRSTEGLVLGEQAFAASFVGVAIGWVLRIAASGWRIPNSPMNLPTAILPLVFGMSVVPALLNNIRLETWFAGMAKYCSLWVFFPIVREYESREQLLGLGVHFIVVSLFMTMRDFVRAPSAGLLAGPEFTSVYFLLSVPLVLAGLAFEVRCWRRALLVGALMLFIARALAAGERSYFVIILITVILMLTRTWWALGWRVKRVLLPFGLLTALLMTMPGLNGMQGRLVSRVLDRFKTLLTAGLQTEANVSIWIRVLETKQAWQVAWKSPLWGWGIATYEMWHPTRFEYYTKSYVHLVPLDLFLSFGLFGVGAVVFWAKRTVALLRRTARIERSTQWNLIIWALYVNLVSIMLLSLVSRVTVSITSLFYLGVAGGAAAALEKIQLAERLGVHRALTNELIRSRGDHVTVTG